MRATDLGPTFGFGASALRLEDDALLHGRGRYTSDLVPRDALHGVVLRSTHAHADFTLAGLEAARAMPGVHLVLTAADVAGLGPLPCYGVIRLSSGSRITVPDYPVLAHERVRHVGDALAFIVADSVAQARDAAEAVMVDYRALPVVVGYEAALDPAVAPIWPQVGSNIAFQTEMGDGAATQAAFAKAHRVVEVTLANNRLVTNYLETRAVVAEFDAATQRFTLTLGSQGSHTMRDVLCDKVLKIPREQMRVITPDVGGGFGTKTFPYREYPLAAFAARRLKRTVAWVSERNEHFTSCAQGRDNLTTAKLALDGEARILALDVDLKADMGAYLSFYAPFIPYIGAGMLPGVYDIPAIHVRITGVYSNTLPVDAYRGAGRPEAAYVIERLMDEAAHALGLAPDEMRRRNFIQPGQMPYTTATGRTYDSGDFARHMARAQDMADWAGFPARAEAARKAGRLRGIGLATYIEACGGGGPENAWVTLEPDGSITCLVGTQTNGQGHITAYAQLVAEHLKLPFSKIRVVQGDTDVVPTGTGTGGSRSIPVGGASVAGASRRLAENLRELAAQALEAASADIEFLGGEARIAGTDRAVSFAQIAALPQATREMLSVNDAFRPPEATYPNGTHVCEVDVDPGTGAVKIVDYVVVDDFGRTLNPLLLAGQVHGGVVQGIGQALTERTVYDRDTGQLLTASFMDYALPRADDVPGFRFETANVPCRTNPLGVKGAGEAGTIGATPAVANAVIDALSRAGAARGLDIPMTPHAVWAHLRKTKPPGA
jgi:carbon-monoxide dehydrogenase large subunit